jgi:hypothetical protein
MKNKICEIEINPFITENGSINREQSICLILDEYCFEPKAKPSNKVIEEIRYIKKRRKENQKEFYPIKSIEQTIGKVAEKKLRGKNRIKQINEIIELLKQLQLKYNYLDISRDFINSILKQHSNLNDLRIWRLLNDIIKKSKYNKERVVIKKYLVNVCNFEKRFKGEIKKSCIKPIDKIWEKRQKIIKFYSFV